MTELSPDILFELRVIRWLLLGLLIIALYLCAVFVIVNKTILNLGNIVSAKNEQNTRQSNLESLIARGMSREAKSIAGEWIAQQPMEPWGHWFIARAHHQLGELVEAKAAFQETIRVSPNWTEAVAPWLQELDEAIKAKGPKLVE